MRAAFLIPALLLFAADVDADFTAALSAAMENQKSPEGAKYDALFGASFAQKHRGSLEKCTEGRAGEDLATFDLVARVGPNGKLEVIRAEPATPVARCLERKMTNDVYPPPPRPSYWVHVRMSIRE
jgi:hypothetical protein